MPAVDPKTLEATQTTSGRVKMGICCPGPGLIPWSDSMSDRCEKDSILLSLEKALSLLPSQYIYVFNCKR